VIDVADEVAKSCQAACRLALHGAGAAAKGVGGFFGTESLDVPEDDSGPHAGRQLAQCLEKAVWMTVGFGALRSVRHVGPGLLAPAGEAALVVDQRVDEDSPRVAIQLHRPDAGPCQIELGEAHLDEILGEVLVTSGHGGGDLEQSFPPASYIVLELLVTGSSHGISRPGLIVITPIERIWERRWLHGREVKDGSGPRILTLS
jgi:hypothetical protein